MVNITDLIGRTKLEPRPYQQRLISRSLEGFLEKNYRSVMIESPTGSGKTSTSLCVIKAMQEVYPTLEVGWISMRRNLLAQARAENTNKGINARIQFVSMFEKNLPGTLLADHADAAPLRMLVVDEAQHDAANTMASMHSRVRPHYILGMTATPYRSDYVKLCFDTVLKDAGLATLIDQGYLSRYHHYTIPQWSVDSTTETYLREPERWGPSIFYYHTLEQCDQATNLLSRAGVSVEMVTGSSDREEQLEKFHDGRATVLVNCMVLTEGFDCVTTDTEVLTETGWRNITEVLEGENCYSLNRDTGLMELTPVLASAGRAVRDDERMVTIKSQHLDLRVTEGHEFHVKYRDPAKHGARENRLSTNWQTLTGAELAIRRSEFQLPLAAPLTESFPGVVLTDDEIRFVAWFLTDGSHNNTSITISQSEKPTKHATRIRDLLNSVGLDFTERLRLPSHSQFKTTHGTYEFRVPTGNSKAQPRSGWFQYTSFLNKEMTPAFHNMTREQFLVLYREMLLGNGSWSNKNAAGWLWTPHKQQADTICMMAILRGLASSVTTETTKHGATVYRVTVRDQRWIGIRPTDPRATKIDLVNQLPNEQVWCLRNKNSTIVVRRNGKVAIIGNCPHLKTVFCRPSCKGVTIQMSGRAFRKHPGTPFKQIVQAQKGWPFVKLALPELQYKWEPERKDWVCLTPNRHINAMNCKMLQALATIHTTIPEFMTKQAEGGRRRRRPTPWGGQS